jgi:hypothetical protein
VKSARDVENCPDRSFGTSGFAATLRRSIGDHMPDAMARLETIDRLDWTFWPHELARQPMARPPRMPAAAALVITFGQNEQREDWRCTGST